MLTKVIPLASLMSVLSCSVLVEESSVDSCSVVNDPTGWHGTLRVRCPELSFTLVYDNSPDGRDPLILEVRGVEARRLSEERTDPYVVKTGDYEELEGWRYEEEWEVGSYRLKGYEYFVSGGTGCYEEEERAVVELYLGGRKLMLLDHYQEETDCGGN